MAEQNAWPKGLDEHDTVTEVRTRVRRRFTFTTVSQERCPDRAGLMEEGLQATDLSTALRSLPSGEPLTLSVLSERFGSRIHGLALFMLAVPDAMPLPIPSVSAILGIPMLAISAHLAIFGETGALPDWLARRRVPEAIVRFLKGRLAGFLSHAERLSHRRMQMIAGRERLIGTVCALLSLLLLLPLPFFNTPPAICLVLLAWGLFHRDGVFVVIGLGASALVVILLAVAVMISHEFLASWLA